MSIKGEGEKEGQWWVKWGGTKLILFLFFLYTTFLRKMLTNIFGTIIKDTKYNEIILKLI
jgi:hypothetical protein